MIKISQQTNNFKVSVGGSEKLSVAADLHVGHKVAMGLKMRFSGAWLDKQRASLKQGSPQQKMFDVALDVLSGKVAPKTVRETGTPDTGPMREIELERPVQDATTISIGFEKPMSEVLGFLGMKDGKGKDLLSLGAKMADALAPAPQRATTHKTATLNDFLMSCRSLTTSILREYLPKPPVYGQRHAPTNNFAGAQAQASGTNLPPRPGASANARPVPNAQPPRADTPPPMPPRPAAGANANANAKPNPNAQPPRADTPPPVPPRPPRDPASTGQRTGTQGSRTDTPPLPPRNKTSNRAQPGSQERPSSAPPRSSSAPPPRPLKERTSTEQPNRQAPPLGKRMQANSFPGANPGSFEPDVNEAQAAGNAALEPGTTPRMSREEYEEKINNAGRSDSSKPSTPPRPEKTSSRPEAEQPKASAADASAKVAEDAKTKPAVKTLYEHLGLSSKNATATEIRKAYMKGSLKFHPDRNRGNATATAEFQKLGNAYEILSDDTKRKDYDDGVIDDEGHDTGVPRPSDAKG